MTAATSAPATRKQPWHLYFLGVAALGVVLLATMEVGAPSSTTRTSRQVVTVQRGVVQATTSGSGNIAAGTDVTVNFNTSGTLAAVYVKVGQHVHKGQLLATLDRAAARLSLKQAEETLTSAEDQLSSDESNYSSSNASLETTGSGSTEFVSETIQQSAATTSTPATGTTATTSTPSTGTSSTTTTSRTTTAPTTSTSLTTTSQTATSPTTTSGSAGNPTSGSSGSTAGSSGSSGSTTGSTVTASTIATDQASVYSARASVRNAQISLAATRLRAPTSGTIVSLESLSPGDAVSSGSSSSASSSGTSSSGSSGSSSSDTSSGSLGGSSSSSGSSSSGSSSSSSSFAEIVNTNLLTMTVAFSESDISKVKIGQPATVTLDAISGLELGAHVTAISTVGTTSSSVVSYDATLTLDQRDPRVKPGMSASGAVITSQGYGLNVANSAVSGSGSLATVSLLRGGQTVQQQVVVGVKGDTRTQILSGLKAGDQVVVTTTLPSTGSSTSGGSSTGSSGTLGGSTGGPGGGGFGGGGFTGGPPGGGGAG